MKAYLWLSTALAHMATLVLSAPALSLSLIPSAITDGTLLPPILAHALGAEKGTVRPLTTSEIDDQIPFGWFAQAAWCSPAALKDWQCSSCKAESVNDFQLYASGGDGDLVQFWYVGWWPAKETIVVAHQGTDFNKTFPVLTDAMLSQSPLEQTLFPGIPAEAKAHCGFQLAHQHTAGVILKAVQELIAEKGAQKIVTTGHSLGGALAFLDALYLKLHLPDVNVAMRTFGQPRVGNRVLAEFHSSNVQDVIRITNQRDLVVQVLPVRLDYSHTPGEQHHSKAGAWHACSAPETGDKRCSLGEVAQRGVSWNEHFGTYAGGIALGAGSCV